MRRICRYICKMTAVVFFSCWGLAAFSGDGGAPAGQSLVLSAPLSYELQFQTNSMVGTLRLMFGLSGMGSASRLMKQIYRDKSSDKTLEAGQLEKLKNIFADLPRGIDMLPGKDALPQQKYRNWPQLLYYFAAGAESVGAFKFIVAGIFPDQQAALFMEAFDYYQHQYDKIYAAPAKGAMGELLGRFDTAEEKTKNGEWLKQLTKFYGPQLAHPIMKIVLVPLYLEPKEREEYKKQKILSVKAQSLGALQILETPLPARQFEDYGVVYHEISHCFLRNSVRAGDFMNKLREREPPWGKICSGLIDEGLAAALGNGYIGKDSKEAEWYHDEFIDKYAKALFPMVEKYLAAGKAMDDALGEEAIQAFKKEFKEATRMLALHFREIHLMTDGLDVHEVSSIMHNDIRIDSEFSNAPLEDEEGKTKAAYLKNDCTQVFVVTPEELDKLAKFEPLDVSLLKKRLAKEKNFVAAIWDSKRNRYCIIMVCEDMKKVPEMAKKLGAAKYIDEL